jgi:hypothetical protein
VCVCVCVCVCAERKEDRGKLCVCVCVWRLTRSRADVCVVIPPSILSSPTYKQDDTEREG